MASRGGYDIVVHVTPGLVNDAVSRILNSPLALLARSRHIVPRHIAYPHEPPDAKLMLSWDSPTYHLDESAPNGVVGVSIAVRGGVSLHPSIYSFKGSVRVDRAARVAMNPEAGPHLALDDPSPPRFDLSNLSFSYADEPRPPQPILTGASAYAIPALTILVSAFAKLPLCYAIGSVALVPPDSSGRAAPASGEVGSPARSPYRSPYRYPVAHAAAATVHSTPGTTLALGISLSDAPGDPSAITPALPVMDQRGPLGNHVPWRARGTAPNLALRLSERGLALLIEGARTAGILEGAFPAGAGPGASPHGWRWEEITTRLDDGGVALTGRFTLGAHTVAVAANLACSINERGALAIRPGAIRLAPEPNGGYSGPDDPTIAAAITASWEAILRRLLQAPLSEQAGGTLVQRFVLPGTDISLDVPAGALVIERGVLTVFYAIPMSAAGALAGIVERL